MHVSVRAEPAATDPLERRLAAVMFTDMVGYTALMAIDEDRAIDLRARYMSAVESHHDAFGGSIIQRLGDGTMSMFPSCLDAVLAGVQIQRELAAQAIPVRIGIHVGDLVVERERLTGEAVNIASRIESFAVPGSVMLSDAAYEQVKNRSDVSAVSLGRFRLKNVGRPFELYAVSSEGLVVPPREELAGKGEPIFAMSGRLPVSVRLVGRAADLERIQDLVRENRIVTITGPGGVGKTAILIELGRTLAQEIPDGVGFVAMADVSEAAAFMPALGTTLDVKEAEERSIDDGVAALIGDSESVLLLDNLEQIVDAAQDLALLVDRCPRLRVVTTSRTRLRITAEREYPLRPLELPPSTTDETAEFIGSYPAVELFVSRGRDAVPDFHVSPENAASITSICRRLDGLPLALELAAARLSILSAEGLLERLDHALEVLTTGPRDAPPRQQTLRAAIDWSHSLLTEREQRLFRQMSVFVGSFALEDLEAVNSEKGESVFDTVGSLAEKALIQVVEGGRFRMLQTIREYALERLEASGEADAVALRHASRYAEVARKIRDGIEGRTQIPSVERGMVEEANLQAALDTFQAAAREHNTEACEAGLRMTGDLWMYWHVRGRNLSARDHALAFLAVDSALKPTVGRAGALITLGLASWMAGEFERSGKEWAEAHDLAVQASADRETCLAALCRALAFLGSDVGKGLQCAQQAIDRSRAVKFEWALGIALTVNALLLIVAGEPGLARDRFEEALGIQRRLGDAEGAGMSLGGLAQLAVAANEISEALHLYGESLSEFEAVGDRGEVARILSEIAWTYVGDGNSAQARAYFVKSIQAHTDIGSLRGVGRSLVGLAASEAVDQRPRNAACIAAVAERYAGEEGIVVVYSDDNPGQRYVESAQASLSSEELARATKAATFMTVEEAMDLAQTNRNASLARREATNGS